MRNPSYRRQLGESGRQAIIDRYHWEREAAALSDLLFQRKQLATAMAVLPKTDASSIFSP